MVANFTMFLNQSAASDVTKMSATIAARIGTCDSVTTTDLATGASGRTHGTKRAKSHVDAISNKASSEIFLDLTVDDAGAKAGQKSYWGVSSV
jgi:hypothetical protein